LDLADDDYEIDFGIFSVKFSKDGREIVVGNNERSIYVYDLGESKVSVRIKAHTVQNHLALVRTNSFCFKQLLVYLSG
jgi:tricorn protease-like protein